MIDREFLRGLNIQLEPHGRGKTLKKRIYNADTGRPTDKVVKVKVKRTDRLSIDKFPPIDPDTGQAIEAFQTPLPDPSKKKK